MSKETFKRPLGERKDVVRIKMQQYNKLLMPPGERNKDEE